ncbi:MAG: hypothetical protein PHX87_05770 [Candidatus Peribacteraceae bacterium]|nr:hypothetical protein [Candidatus Peribacteraceae bacterium]MDD5742899.1 hypothetical protein [Candidatus Peribacteraceae bacterium]
MSIASAIDGISERSGSWFLSSVQAVPSFGWLLLSALFFGCGEFFSKKWALAPSFGGGIAVVVVDAIGVVLWLPALLNRNQLSIVGVLWALLGAVVTVSIGLLIFRESLTWVQWIGIVCAFVALALLQK